MLSIEWIQHAVGHGGFHTGLAVPSGSVPFTWIFDCGSRRTARFNEYLRAWMRAHPQPVDWLFISHFDTDHVSGLETLMARVKVRDVMVPYVNEHELAFALIEEIARDHVEHWFTELAADPAGYLLSRGAERVTFLGGAGGGSEVDFPRPAPHDGKDWMVKIHPAPMAIAGSQRAKASASLNVQRIEASGCDMVAVNATCADVRLRLKPYRAPIEKRMNRALLTELSKKVGAGVRKGRHPGLGDLAYAIAEKARSATGRAELRSIFASHVGSSNRASLSLLSAPEVTGSKDGHWKRSPYPGWRARGQLAWVNTGDAELLADDDLGGWANHYGRELGQVGTLVLPHHGSDRNSNEALQNLCQRAALLAPVKDGAKKHPGSAVAEAAGSRLFCVTDCASAEFSQRFYCP